MPTRSKPKSVIPPLLPTVRFTGNQTDLPVDRQTGLVVPEVIPPPEPMVDPLLAGMGPATMDTGGELQALDEEIASLLSPAPNLAYQRQLPPPILPPIIDRSGEQEQVKRALQVAGLMPLLGRLVGAGDIGDVLAPQALTAALGGIRSYGDRNLQDQVNQYNLNRQGRSDEVESIDFVNDLVRQEENDRQSRLREARLTRQGIARERKTEADIRLAEEKGRQAALTNIRNTAKEFPNNPELIYSLHSEDIRRHNIEVDRNENGDLTIDGSPIELRPRSLVQQEERSAQRIKEFEVSEKIRQGNRLELEDYRTINKSFLEEQVQNNRMSLQQARLVYQDKWNTERNAIARNRLELSRERNNLRQSGILDVKSSSLRLEHLGKHISSLKDDIAELERYKLGFRVRKPGGRMDISELTDEELAVANTTIEEKKKEIKEAESLREVYMQGAGLKLLNGEYVPRTGGTPAGTSSQAIPRDSAPRIFARGTPEDIIGTFYGKQRKRLDCANGVCEIAKALGYNIPKISRAADLQSHMMNRKDFVTIPDGGRQAQAGDIVTWYSPSAPSKTHAAVAVRPGKALGVSTKAGYKFAEQNIPAGATVFRPRSGVRNSTAPRQTTNSRTGVSSGIAGGAPPSLAEQDSKLRQQIIESINRQKRKKAVER